MSIILVDSRSDSLTVTWPAITGADYYMLEFRTDGSEWELLADDLITPLAVSIISSPGLCVSWGYNRSDRIG